MIMFNKLQQGNANRVNRVIFKALYIHQSSQFRKSSIIIFRDHELFHKIFINHPFNHCTYKFSFTAHPSPSTSKLSVPLNFCNQTTHHKVLSLHFHHKFIILSALPLYTHNKKKLWRTEEKKEEALHKRRSIGITEEVQREEGREADKYLIRWVYSSDSIFPLLFTHDLEAPKLDAESNVIHDSLCHDSTLSFNLIWSQSEWIQCRSLISSSHLRSDLEVAVQGETRQSIQIGATSSWWRTCNSLGLGCLA